MYSFIFLALLYDTIGGGEKTFITLMEWEYILHEFTKIFNFGQYVATKGIPFSKDFLRGGKQLCLFDHSPLFLDNL